MEQRVNELSCKNHEAWQISLEGGVYVLVLIGRDFEILLKLSSA